MTDPAPARRPATAAELETLGSAVRLRILRLTHLRPLSNKEIAERLGKDPATTLHHVRKLVDAGFLVADPPRRGNRGAREIPYRSSGLTWGLEVPDGGVELSEAMLQAYLGEVSDAGLASLTQTRLVVQLAADDRAELLDRVKELFEEYVHRPHEPGAERTAIYLSWYPEE